MQFIIYMIIYIIFLKLSSVCVCHFSIKTSSDDFCIFDGFMKISTKLCKIIKIPVDMACVIKQRIENANVLYGFLQSNISYMKG